MNKFEHKVITILCVIISMNVNAQEIFNPENYDFECTGNLVMPAEYEVQYIYDGDDPSIETIEKIEKVKIGTKWEKRKADRNCLSADPKDCLVWCLVQETEDRYIQIVVDTSTTTEWHEHKKNIRPAGQKERHPVICKYQLTPKLLAALRDKLFALNYDVDPNKKYTKLKGKFNKEFKQFQYDYDLPVGKWSAETMEFLYNLDIK